MTDGQNQPEDLDNKLASSINYFLAEYPISIASLRNLDAMCQMLMRDFNDPPLEIIWFWGAVKFLRNKQSLPSEKLSADKDLLHWLNYRSCSCGVLKKVAVIAPVLYLLYHLELNFSARDASLREGIRNAVDQIISYISICCSQCVDEGDQGSDSLGAHMLDLISVWTVDQVRDSHNLILESFFPTLNDESRQEVTVSLRYLAGVVMKETLLLRLFLKISSAISKEDLWRDLLNLAIQTIKGFRSFYFVDENMLLNMLLEPRLPVADSLSSEDAAILDKALYDAVILVEYSFYCGGWVESSLTQSKTLALVWMLAADHAIQFARVTGDQARAFCYLNSFRESQLVFELTKWVLSQPRMVDRNARPDVTTPRALIQWLLVLEDQGIQVFDHSMSRLREKAVACMSRLESQLPDLMSRIENLNQNIFGPDITYDLTEDLEMNDQSNNSCPGALCLMSPTGEAGNKRKEGPSGENDSRVKQVGLNTSGNGESSGSGSHGKPNASGNRELPFSSGSGSHEAIAIPSEMIWKS